MDPSSGVLERMVYAPEMLARCSAQGYTMESEERLATIARPTFVITGESDRTCTPRAAPS